MLIFNQPFLRLASATSISKKHFLDGKTPPSSIPPLTNPPPPNHLQSSISSPQPATLATPQIPPRFPKPLSVPRHNTLGLRHVTHTLRSIIHYTSSSSSSRPGLDYSEHSSPAALFFPACTEYFRPLTYRSQLQAVQTPTRPSRKVPE